MFEELIIKLNEGSKSIIENIKLEEEKRLNELEEKMNEKQKQAYNGLALLAKKADLSFAVSLSDKISEIEIEIEDTKSKEKESILNEMNERKEKEVRNNYNLLYKEAFKEVLNLKDKMMLVRRTYKDSSELLKTALDKHNNEILELELLSINNNVLMLNNNVSKLRGILFGFSKLYNKENETYDFTGYTLEYITSLTKGLISALNEIKLIDELDKEVREFVLPDKKVDRTSKKEVSTNEQEEIKDNSVNNDITNLDRELDKIIEYINCGLATKPMIDNMDNLFNELPENIDKNVLLNLNKKREIIKKDFYDMKENTLVKEMILLINDFNNTNDNTYTIPYINRISDKYNEIKNANIPKDYMENINKKINEMKKEILSTYSRKLKIISDLDEFNEIKNNILKLFNETNDFFTKEEKKELITLRNEVEGHFNKELDMVALRNSMRDDLFFFESLPSIVNDDIKNESIEKLKEYEEKINNLYNNNNLDISLVDKYNELVDLYYSLNQRLTKNINLEKKYKGNSITHKEYDIKTILTNSHQNFKNKLTGEENIQPLNSIREQLAQNIISKLNAKVRLYGLDKLKSKGKEKKNYRLYKHASDVIAKGLYKALNNKEFEDESVKEACEMWIRTLAVASKKGFNVKGEKVEYNQIFTKAYDYITNNKDALGEETYNIYLNNILGILRNKKENELYDFIEQDSQDEIFLNNDIDKSMVPLKYAYVDSLVNSKIAKSLYGEDDNAAVYKIV